MSDTGLAAGLSTGQTGRTHRFRGLVVTGLLAALVAVVATTLAAALARAIGVDFELPEGGEAIPLSGFAVVTGFFSLVGIAIATALLRWSANPAKRFVWTAGTLTVISFVPPFLVDADAATVTALLVLHLVVAAVMIPALARSINTMSSAGLGGGSRAAK